MLVLLNCPAAGAGISVRGSAGLPGVSPLMMNR